MAITLESARREGRELFRPVEVAQMGGFSPTFVYQLINTKKLKAVRIGGTLRIRFEEVERLLTEGVTPSVRE